MKNKTIIIHKDHGAKIYINQEVDAPEGYKKLVNPNTEMVDNFPPELWKLQDSKLVPVTEPEEVRRRMEQIKLLPEMAKAIGDHDVDLRAGLSTISQLPLQIDDGFYKLANSFSAGFYALNTDLGVMEARERLQISRVFLELKHQRHLLIGVILTLLVLAATIFVVGR